MYLPSALKFRSPFTMNRSLAEACELMERSPEVKFQSMRVATVNADQQLAIRKELIVDAGDDNQSSRDYH
jgi:hypothetical protein